jgi:uncharacterized membrane-anchored protein YitT (DUF2179 family)
VKRSQVFVATLVCIMYVLAGGALLFADPPQGARDALLVLIGGISTAFGTVISYAFGSSSGSTEKTAIISRQQTGKPT